MAIGFNEHLAEASFAPAIVWSIVILALLLLGMMAAARLRRKLKQEDVTTGPASGFTLSDLRRMHRAGQLTDAEFERAKERVVLAAQKAAARAAPPPGTPAEKDSADAIRARRWAKEAQEGAPPEDRSGA